MTYWEKLKSPEWQKKRLEIMHRDNFMCVCCLSTENELHVHHHYYKANKEMLIQRSKARYQANKDNILEAKRLKLIAKKLSEDNIKQEHGNEPSDDEVNQSTTK